MKKITLLFSALFFSIYINAQCSAPSNIGWDVFEYTRIIWDANGEDNWDIEFGETGFSPTGIPTVEDLVYPSFSLYDIAETSVYIDIYVRADCSTNTSDWVGPFTFFNYCLEFCFFDDFESGTFHECWSESNEGSPITRLGTIDTSLWEIDSFANVSSNSAKINIFGNQVHDWLITPRIVGGPDVYLSVKYDIALTEHNSTEPTFLGSDDVVMLVYSVDVGETWEVLKTWDSSTVISNIGEHETIVTGFSGIDYIPFLVAFWASSGSNIDPENVDFFIDNFDVCFTVGIEENLLQKGFTYYPNPTVEIVNLSAKEVINLAVLYNSLGQEVKRVAINNLSDQLDISELPDAVYYMHVRIGDTIGVVPVVKN